MHHGVDIGLIGKAQSFFGYKKSENIAKRQIVSLINFVGWPWYPLILNVVL